MPLAPSLLKRLRAIVGHGNVLDGTVDLQTYEYDGFPETHRPDAVAFVHSTDEVAAVVKALHEARVPFVPRGYGTNLSGGTLPVRAGVVIELSRMNRILEIDIADRCVAVQPGVFTLDVSTALAPLGYHYAPDPASERASSIGGNIAENAGGPHCFKYGVTSNHVLGLEVVLPDGDVVWLGGKHPEPLGLDLTGLFVGSEGTLGIVTAAILRILRRPEAVKTILAAFSSVDDAAQAVSSMVSAGMTPATLELMDHRSVNAVEDALACGLPRDAGAVLLVELDGLVDGLDEATAAVTDICRAHRAVEVRTARDEDERDALWQGRRGCYAAITWSTSSYLMDGTVPRTMLPSALRQVTAIAQRHDVRVFTLAHAGDGNLHPVFVFDQRDADERRRVMAAGHDVLAACVALGGTISGEHGVGLEKLDAMSLVFGAEELRAQRMVKEVFDPAGWCNPGKLLPEPA